MLGGPIEDDDKKQFLELQEQFKANESQFENMNKDFSERLEEAKRKDAENAKNRIDISKPHLVVLNQDPQLSHKLKYSLVNLPFYVGRKLANPPPQIVLFGIGIKMNHAVFEKGKKYKVPRNLFNILKATRYNIHFEFFEGKEHLGYFFEPSKGKFPFDDSTTFSCCSGKKTCCQGSSGCCSNK